MSEMSISYNVEELKKLDIPNMIGRGDEPCLIKLAINAGADIHAYNDLAILKAMKHKNSIEILKMLKDEGMKFDTEIAAQYVCDAIEQNYLAYARFIIENGVDIDYEDNRIFDTALNSYIDYNYDKWYYGIIKVIINKMDIDYPYLED